MPRRDQIRITRLCEMCGSPFECSISRNKKFCSYHCRYVAKKAKEQAEMESKAPVKPKEWTYENMLAERELNRSYAERQKQKTIEMYGRVYVPPKGDNNG